MEKREPGSFRDPSGYVYWSDGKLYRSVQKVYQPHYDLLMSSGLYADLAKRGLLIPHEEVQSGPEGYKTLLPEQIPFISYPYEWCFGQYKEAALATLTIAQDALKKGLMLKDASAYNIQFHKGKAVFIDTLSFETYVEGAPWVAYRQFCEHFLAPLAMASKVDSRLTMLTSQFIDGIPLDLASSVLQGKSRFNLGLGMHVHGHAKAQKGGQPGSATPSHAKVSKTQMLALLDSLQSTINGLTWDPPKSVWSAYYAESTYSEADLKAKEELVGRFLSKAAPKIVWDLGANTGRFSRVASRQGLFCMSCDGDSLAVELNYRDAKREKDANVLPLRIDLANPTPAIGWGNEERMSLEGRGPADCVLALALIHHLAINNNVPLPSVAEVFSRYAKDLIIEWVPAGDQQVRRMMADRTRSYDQYTDEEFSAAFDRYFEVVEQAPVAQMGRTLYLMRRR